MDWKRCCCNCSPELIKSLMWIWRIASLASTVTVWAKAEAPVVAIANAASGTASASMHQVFRYGCDY